MTLPNNPILIAGAGIAGLAATIALSARGFSVRVLEKRQDFSDAGAGIQIGPNGVKALRTLGLGGAVERHGFKPSGIALYDGASGRLLNTLPLGEVSEARFGAPYTTWSRAGLQSVLREAALAANNVAIETGFDLAGIDPVADGFVIRSVDGRTTIGSALIGADGVWSHVRAWQGNPAPTPSGYAAYRATIPRLTGADRLPAPFGDEAVCVWFGHAAHVVHYPVDGGAKLNVVVIVRAPPGPTDWDQPGAVADLTPHLAGWSPELVAMLQRAPEWRRWSVLAQAQTGAWAKGRTLRIGDAAHPILPFLAQGAVMALEDAVVLTDAMARAPAHPTQAFARFETIRRQRVERVAAASQRNGAINHMTGLPALARNAVLRWTPPARLLARFDWLYGYDVSGPR